jgi:hypothetical protein
MPVHVRPRNGRFCVEEPNGTVVPDGCYDEESDAVARMQAININIHEPTKNAIISMNENMSEKTEVLEQETVQDETEEKGLPAELSLVAGPTSFAELGEVREAAEKEKTVHRLLSDFMSLAGNVFSMPGSKKSSQVKGLVKELHDILPDDEDDEEDEKIKAKWSTSYKNNLPDSAFFYIEPGGKKDSEGKTTPRSLRHLPYKNSGGKVDIPHVQSAIQRANQVVLKNGKKIGSNKVKEIRNKARKILAFAKKDDAEIKAEPLFYIWKEQDGIYRWLGVYSNKFRDNDTPAEILAEKAHLHFIERVEKGELDYPSLYIWHIPHAIGKADLLAYDNAGFSVVAGTIDEEYAIVLAKSSEDLAMSHGMSSQYIRRDEEDPTIIIEYVSEEVSILPRYAAANKMTEFLITKDEEEPMAIIPDEKRQQVAELLGEELTNRLESGLLAKGEKAIADGVEHKEEAKVENAETEGEAASDAKPEESVESSAEAEEKVSDSNDNVESADVDAIEKDGENKELAKTLGAIVEAFTVSQGQVVDAVKALTERIDNIENSVNTLESSDETKIAKLAAGTPSASLEALLLEQLGHKPGSVIGTKAALVHGNHKLAKEKPLETEHDDKETEGAYSGLFFNQWQGK